MDNHILKHLLRAWDGSPVRRSQAILPVNEPEITFRFHQKQKLASVLIVHIRYVCDDDFEFGQNLTFRNVLKFRNRASEYKLCIRTQFSETCTWP